MDHLSAKTFSGRLPSGGAGGYLAAALLVVAATGACELARPYLSPVNMVMAYLLAVVLAALFLGRNPAMAVALLGVLAFDFFFVPPRLSFQIHDKEYLVTFLALFTVGVVISSLVARARESLETLRIRERQTKSLYHLTRDLAAAADTPALLDVAVRNIEQSLGTPLAVFLNRDGELALVKASDGLVPDREEINTAQWSLRSRRMAGHGTDSYRDSRLTFIPLKALADTPGVLAVGMDAAFSLENEQQRTLLDAFAAQIALALERRRLINEAQEAQILKASDNLERALLNSISHDLRTPLAAITGALSAVLDEGGLLGAESRRELLETAREEAGRLNRFVGNLLDMTRLEAGALQPRLEPCDVQDLIGCALAAVEPRLDTREISVRLAEQLPLVPLDFVLMIQVVVNLLENALKYTPAGARVEIAARTWKDRLVIEVADAGPGVPPKELERIFDKFHRTQVPEVAGGTGLGLSICPGIVAAPGGSIRAAPRAAGASRVISEVPLGNAAGQRYGDDE